MITTRSNLAPKSVAWAGVCCRLAVLLPICSTCVIDAAAQDKATIATPGTTQQNGAPTVSDAISPSDAPSKWFLQLTAGLVALLAITGIVALVFAAVLFFRRPESLIQWILRRYRTQEKGEGRDVSEKEEERLTKMFHDSSDLLFTQCVLTIGTILILCMLGIVLLPSGFRATASTSDVLSLSENILSVVAIVLALAAIGGASFAHLLRRNVDEKLELFEKRIADAETISRALGERSSDVERALDSSRQNVILCADLALTTLPAATFSQQLSLENLQTLRKLDETFDERFTRGGRKLWEQLRKVENGARIRYARALYKLGRKGHEPSEIGTSDLLDSPADELKDPEKDQTVLGLLSRAKKLADEGPDVALCRDIRVRLFQAYRQLDNCIIKKAVALIEGINDLDEDEQIILEHWATMVAYLQGGFAEKSRNTRISHFRESADAASNLLAKVPAFFAFSKDDKESDNRGPVAIDENEAGQLDWAAAVYYYWTKSVWALDFALKQPKDDVLLNNCQKDFRAIANAAVRSLQRGLRRVRDPYTRATYNASLAYLGIAMLYNNAVPPAHKMKKRDIEEYLRRADAHYTYGNQRIVREFKGDRIPIYSDHREQLVEPKLFRSFLRDLRLFLKKKEWLLQFYEDGTRPPKQRDEASVDG